MISVKTKYKKTKNKIYETKNLRLNNAKSRKHLNWNQKLVLKIQLSLQLNGI